MNTGKSWHHLQFICASCLALACVLQVTSLRFLYADGASLFVQNLSADNFSDFYWPRQEALWLTQWPFVCAMWLGVTDIFTLAWLNGLGLYGTPLALAALTAMMTQPDRRQTLLLLAAVLPVMGITSSHFIVSESHVAALQAIFLCYYLAADGRAEPGNPHRWRRNFRAGWAVAVAISAVCSYESFALYGPPLAWVALRQLRRSRKQDPGRQMALIAIGLAMLIAAVLGAYFIFASPLQTVYQANVPHLLGRLSRDVNAWTCLVVLSGITYALRQRRAAAPLALPTLALAATLAACWGLLPQLSWRFNPVALHYPARLITIALPLWLGAMLWTWQPAPGRAQRAWALVALLNLGNLVWQGSTSLAWLQFRGQVSATLQKATGLITVHQAELDASPYAESPWWLPSFSIALACLHSDTIHSMITAPPSEFSKFAPEAPRSWPSLGRYRCAYAPGLLQSAQRAQARGGPAAQ